MERKKAARVHKVIETYEIELIGSNSQKKCEPTKYEEKPNVIVDQEKVDSLWSSDFLD